MHKKIISAPEYLESKGWKQQGELWVKRGLRLTEAAAFDKAYKRVGRKKTFIIQEDLFYGS